MKLLISVLFVFSFNFAGAFNFPSSDIPDDSQWAKAMTERACKVKFNKSTVGTIDKAKNGVVYSVFNKNGEMIASAWAKSTFILAKKKCLMK